MTHMSMTAIPAQTLMMLDNDISKKKTVSFFCQSGGSVKL